MYVIITVAIRLMGKRQIGDMQPNELVITLLISELAAIPLQDTNEPVLNGILAIFILVVLEIAVSVITMKSFLFRKLFNGKSVVIIKNGVVDQEAMKRVRMTVLDLVEQLRSQSIFDISTVAYAVLEVNGELSVLLDTKSQPVTNEDMKIKKKSEGLPLPVISDGKLMTESLNALQMKEKDIEKNLKKQNLKTEDVYLMTLDRFNNCNIIRKKDKK